MSTSSDRIAVLTVRVWINPATTNFVVRISHTEDVATQQPTTAVAVDPGEVATFVRHWLDDILKESGGT
jgi:hypothetical protein